MRNQRVEGIILGPVYSQQSLKLIWEFKERFPMVVFSGLEHLDVDYVTVDREKGVFSAVKHLVKLGHKKIAYLCLPFGNLYFFPKYRGYMKAIYQFGLPFYKEWIIREKSTMEGGYKAMKKILSFSNRPTAVVCHSDLSAFGAIRCAKDRGLHVPEDMAVVGFDNIREGEYSVPSLTTVDQPKERMAKELVRLLLERIENPKKKVEEILLPARLIIRESSGKER